MKKRIEELIGKTLKLYGFEIVDSGSDQTAFVFHSFTKNNVLVLIRIGDTFRVQNWDSLSTEEKMFCKNLALDFFKISYYNPWDFKMQLGEEIIDKKIKNTLVTMKLFSKEPFNNPEFRSDDTPIICWLPIGCRLNSGSSEQFMNIVNIIIGNWEDDSTYPGRCRDRCDFFGKCLATKYLAEEG